MENKEKFDIAEFLVLRLSEEIKENMTVVQGTATFIPLVATMLAMEEKKIKLIGGFLSNPKINPQIPSTFCFANYNSEKSYLGLSKFLDMLQNRQIDLEFLRPAQVDKFGNINNTVIGKYSFPKVRLPGGMGLDDVMKFIKKIILYVPNHNKLTFVDKVDFVTAGGWDKGKGPDKIITNMCVFEFPNKEITLTEINPFCSVEEIRQNTGFEFKIAPELKKMPLPDDKDSLLISRLDPKKLRNLEIKEKREEVLRQFKEDYFLPNNLSLAS